jgi:hypothetical protein
VCIKRRAGALANLPRCGKVVSTKVGCGRFDGKHSRVAPALFEKEGSMAAAISNHDGLITRRSIFIGAAASLLCAPAIVRATSLMPVRRPPPPFGPQYAGFVDRLYFHALDGSLRIGLRAGQTSIHFNGTIMPVAEAQRIVTRAQDYGWLPPYISIYRND